MKILSIDCRVARMSGLGVYTRNLVPHCMTAMPDVHFRLLGHDDSFPVPPGSSWEPVSVRAPVYSIAEQLRIPPLVKGSDAYWSPHYPVPVFADVPIVATIHDVAHLALRDLYGGIKRLYAKTMLHMVRHKAAELLFVSEFSRQEFLRYVGEPRGNVTVAHNGLDASWLQLPLREKKTPPYFLAVGNIKPHKNLPFLARAFSRIAGKCDATLLLVGERDGFCVGESVESLADICPGRIAFTGFVPHRELVVLMSEAAALVFPSRYEGFGLPLLEALGAGVPVLAADTRISHEVCDDFAAYFSLDSEERLGEMLLEILDLPPDERSARGERGRAWAARFSWEKTAASTVAALRRALSC